LENEALNKNIGHGETTLVGYHILHLSILIWWGTTSIKFGVVVGNNSFVRS